MKKWHHLRIPVTYAICNHKYTQAKVYPKVTFGYNDKSYSYPLARFLYAWFRGEVPEGYVVDHIDNNPFNNYINPYDINDPKNNLQTMTSEENNRKRYIDNPENYRNQ